MFSKISRLPKSILRWGWRKSSGFLWLIWVVFWREVYRNLGIIIGYGVVGCLGIALTVFMLVPSYKDPSSRMYTSGMGYGAMKRKYGIPFDVTGARAKRREVIIPYLGEGLITGTPIRLAMIPIAKVNRLHVKEGDLVKQGELLLELDDLEARRKLASAETALATAKAELGRVIESGSTYVLAQERPEEQQIKLRSAQDDLRAKQEKLRSQESMLRRGLLARALVDDTRAMVKAAEHELESAKFFAEMASKGAPLSEEIARNNLKDAQQAVDFRKSELANYKLYAPYDGVVSAVLIHEGEFNSDTGKPAFLITHGMWFEGYFDQAVLSRFQVGQEAEVFLEAHPGEMFPARVAKIIPEVTFSSGGPEIARPLRPRGTGAPEWAATFRVRFELIRDNVPSSLLQRLALGMTGNVKVLTRVNTLTLPRNGVLSVAAARALVTVPPFETLNEGTTGWTQKQIKLGYVGHDWVEVVEGLDDGDIVFVKGHRIIREGDVVQMVELVE